MTTSTIRLDNALPSECVKNSPTLDSIAVFGTDGSARVIQRQRSSVQENSKPCVVLHMEAVHAKRENSANFNAFDELVESLERDEESSAKLSEGRKWVAGAFYDGAPTLASLRLAAGLSQKQLAQICKIEQPHISRFESGKHEPSLTLIETLAQALGVNLETFFEAWKNSRKKNNLELSQ